MAETERGGVESRDQGDDGRDGRPWTDRTILGEHGPKDRGGASLCLSLSPRILFQVRNDVVGETRR